MSWGRQGVLMGLTAIVDLLRTLTAIVDWESRVALTPVPLGARLADLDSHESQASLLSHSLLGDQIQKVNCATECEDMPITSSTSSSKLCGWAPVLFCELDGQRSSPRQGAHRLLGLLAMIKSRASTHSCFSVFGFLAMIKSRASTHSCSRLAGLGHRRRLAELGPDGCRELSSARRTRHALPTTQACRSPSSRQSPRCDSGWASSGPPRWAGLARAATCAHSSSSGCIM